MGCAVQFAPLPSPIADLRLHFDRLLSSHIFTASNHHALLVAAHDHPLRRTFDVSIVDYFAGEGNDVVLAAGPTHDFHSFIDEYDAFAEFPESP